MTIPTKSGPIDLHGQVALVTGAAKGIGRTIVLALAREGATVVAMDVLDCAETMAALAEAGGRGHAVICDVTDEAGVNRLVADTVERYGRLDILVNNAAIMGPTRGTGEWDRVIEVNLKGPFIASMAVLPYMERQGYGKIVHLSSKGAKDTGHFTGVAYAASKGGLNALSRWVAKMYGAKGIFSNVVAPGPTDTDMNTGRVYPSDTFLLGRMGAPEDTAEAVVFLASQASNYVSGTILDVNGGIRFN